MPLVEKRLNNPLPVLIVLTVILQASNFVWDWQNLRFYDHVNIRNNVDLSDNAQYSGIATNLLSGNGYAAPLDAWSMREGVPTYYRSPGVPLIYTIPLLLFSRDSGYRITESNRMTVWVTLYAFQLFLVCLGTVYFYKICQLLLSSPFASLMGTLVYVVWPSNLIYLSAGAGFYPESIVPPLLIWVSYILHSEKRIFYQLLAGAILGFCILVRCYLVFVPFFLLLLACLFRNQASFRRLWIAALVAIVVLLPWPMRNYLLFGDFSLGSQGGWNLLIGNNATARGSGDGNIWTAGKWRIQQYPILKDLNEKYPGLLDGSKHYSEREANKIFQREAIDWASANASVLPWLLGRKLAILFFPANFLSEGISWITAVGFLAFVPGLLLYIARCWNGLESAEFLILTVPILCICLVTLVFYAEYRQRFIMEPFMLLFALYAFRLAADPVDRYINRIRWRPPAEERDAARSLLARMESRP